MPVSARRTIKIILFPENPAPRDMTPKNATPAINAYSDAEINNLQIKTIIAKAVLEL